MKGDLARLFRSLDTNRDGQIDRGEFSRWVRVREGGGGGVTSCHPSCRPSCRIVSHRVASCRIVSHREGVGLMRES